MSNNFFSRFPVIDYDMDGQGSFLNLTNIVKNVDVNDVYINSSTFYTYHDIMDGERPDTISYKLYGSPNFYWTFFILNNDLRAGLNEAWPLSSRQLDYMMEKEYDPYMAITFLPESNSISGKGPSGLMNMLFLWDEFLPYLRLTNVSGTEQAKILKYDSALLQLIIYDIEKSDGSGLVASTDNFKESQYFRIVWINPYEEGSETTGDDWIACQALKTDFINKTVQIYKEFDSAATINLTLLPDNATPEEIAEIITNYSTNYVFSKEYIPANIKYRWASYRNAAFQYFQESEGESYSTSALDTVLDENILEPKYITFAEKEEIINSKKEKIRVIRPDKINEFVNAYFSTLNGR